MPHFEVFANHPENLRIVSEACHDFAVKMVASLDDGPELTAGLRRLLEAKDCFVRQRVVDESHVG